MRYILSVLFLVFIFFANIASANETVEITDLSTAKAHASETNTKLILVFGADWCGYCKNLDQAIEANMDLINTRYTVCYIDYDEHRDLAKLYNVKSLPTTIVLNGKTMTRITGFSSFNGYKRSLGL